MLIGKAVKPWRQIYSIDKRRVGMALMLDRLVGMFMGNKVRQHKAVAAPPSHSDAFLRLNAIAPLVSEINNPSAIEEINPAGTDDSHPGKSIVCREAVLGSDQRVAGYFFMLRHGVNLRVRASSTNIQRLYDEVLLRNLQAMDIQRLLEHRLAFIDVSASSLELPLLEELPSQGTVYVVGPNTQLAANPESLSIRLAHLKEQGYRIGLQGVGVDSPGMASIVELADFLFIDIGGNDIPTIKNQMDVAGTLAASMKFVATNIQTLEDFNVCARLPFPFYQGPFITSREKWAAPRMDAGRIKILELLNKLRRDAEAAELTTLIKQDPALSFKLLRYINSPGMGLMHKVGSLDQALIVLGRQKLYRWLTLLLFTSGKTRGLDWAIMENALVRARLAELVAQNSLPADERDELFVAGVFSLLDIVLATPMEAVLKQVSLPPLVNEVLLHHRGKYAPFLELAIACEQSDQANISTLSEAIGLDSNQVNNLHLDALIWAQQVSE
jgi:EAL and modified HD-GYP domain-containing signal transduction protein